MAEQSPCGGLSAAGESRRLRILLAENHALKRRPCVIRGRGLPDIGIGLETHQRGSQGVVDTGKREGDGGIFYETPAITK
jgi:hypothetical protein